MVAIGNIISLVVLLIGWFPRESYFQSYEMIIYFFCLSAVALIGLFIFLCVSSLQEHTSEITVVNDPEETVTNHPEQ